MKEVDFRDAQGPKTFQPICGCYGSRRSNRCYDLHKEAATYVETESLWQDDVTTCRDNNRRPDLYDYSRRFGLYEDRRHSTLRLDDRPLDLHKD